MKLSLLVMTAGKQEGKLIEIKLPQFLVGRDPQCQLRPASPLISKRHCAIIQREGKAFIRDFGSTNGTFLNDDPVKGEAELHNEDVLKVGPILFTVRMEAEPAAMAKTPVPPTKQPAAKATASQAMKETPAPATKTPAPATKATASKTPAPATKPAATSKPAAKETPAKTPTPAPATTAAKAVTKPTSGNTGDDDIMAMLMGLDSDEDSPSSARTGDPVPDGSTMHEIQLPPEMLNPKPGEAKPAAGQKPAPTGDTRSAAARILEKLTKRPRN